MTVFASMAVGLLGLPLCSLVQLMPLPLWQMALLPLLAMGGCGGAAARTDTRARAVSEWVDGADTAHVRLQGLEMEGCMHARVGEEGGLRLYRLSGTEGLDLFLALNSDSQAVLRLESEQIFVPSTGETDTVVLVGSAMAGGLTFEQWLEAETAGGIPVDSLYEIYDQQYLEALGRR